MSMMTIDDEDTYDDDADDDADARDGMVSPGGSFQSLGCKKQAAGRGGHQTTFPPLKKQKNTIHGMLQARFSPHKAIHIQKLLMNTQKNPFLLVCNCLSQRPKPPFVLLLICSKKIKMYRKRGAKE